MPGHQSIAEMTLDELEALVEEIVRCQVSERSQPNVAGQTSRSLDEIFASIDRNMIILPPGAKSSLDLLREDRER